MRIKIAFSLMISLILGALNLYSEEVAAQTDQPPQENRTGTGWNDFANGFVTAYKIIENGVVTGYKAVEDGVVSTYKTIENWFTKTFNIPVPGQSSQTVNPSNEAATEGE